MSAEVQDLTDVEPSRGYPLLRCEGITIVIRLDLPRAMAYSSGRVLYVAPSTTTANATAICHQMAQELLP